MAFQPNGSPKITAADCGDPQRLSKLLQGLFGRQSQVASSQRSETQRLAAGLASVASDVADLAEQPKIDVLRTITGIDLTSAAGTLLFTAGSGTFRPLGFSVRLTSVSSVSVAPTVGVGTANNTTNIFAPRTLSGTLAVGEGPTFFPSGYRPNLSTGNSAYFVVTGAATATTLVASIDLIGYEL